MNDSFLSMLVAFLLVLMVQNQAYAERPVSKQASTAQFSFEGKLFNQPDPKARRFGKVTLLSVTGLGLAAATSIGLGALAGWGAGLGCDGICNHAEAIGLPTGLISFFALSPAFVGVGAWAGSRWARSESRLGVVIGSAYLGWLPGAALGIAGLASDNTILSVVGLSSAFLGSFVGAIAAVELTQPRAPQRRAPQRRASGSNASQAKRSKKPAPAPRARTGIRVHLSAAPTKDLRGAMVLIGGRT